MKSDRALPFFREEISHAIRCELTRRARAHLSGVRIADIACGEGWWLAQFRNWGARPEDLFGLEIDPRRLSVAARTCPGSNLLAGDARAVPLEEKSFEIVSIFSLLTSVVGDDDRAKIGREAMRIARPEGLIIVYDFFAPNPWNSRTRSFRRGDLRQIFAGCEVVTKGVGVAPPVARFALRFSNRLTRGAARIPLLQTHFVAFIHTPG